MAEAAAVYDDGGLKLVIFKINAWNRRRKTWLDGRWARSKKEARPHHRSHLQTSGRISPGSSRPSLPRIARLEILVVDRRLARRDRRRSSTTSSRRIRGCTSISGPERWGWGRRTSAGFRWALGTEVRLHLRDGRGFFPRSRPISRTFSAPSKATDLVLGSRYREGKRSRS